MTRQKSEVQLQVIELISGGKAYQTLAINLLSFYSLIDVEEMLNLQLPSELDWQREIIIYGRAPMWLYTHLVWRFADVPWVACYDIREQKAIVVSSHIPEITAGDVFPIEFKTNPGIAILIGGPPGSGKSVLSYALPRALVERKPACKIYVHRANWDGEGSYVYETENQDLAKQLRSNNKTKLHHHPNAEKLTTDYFKYQAEATKNILQVMDLVLVDIGGMPRGVEMPLIEECQYYIVISKTDSVVETWHQLCGQNLKPIAVIHSVWEDCCQVLKREPCLEIKAGKWELPVRIPEELLEEILQLLP